MKKLNFFIAFIFCLQLVYAQDSTLSITDIPPLFEGCNDPLISKKQQQECSTPKIQAFVHENIVYPDSAKENDIEGVVVVRFWVEKDGLIKKIELIRDIGYGCGQEAMRVVRMMPKFTPALQNGKPIATQMTLPVRFKKINTSKQNNKNLYQLYWGTIYGNSISKKELKSLLKIPLVARDYYGNIYDITYLKVELKTNNKTFDAQQKGNTLSKDMLKILQKSKSMQQLTLHATIQKDYTDIKIVRQLTLK